MSVDTLQVFFNQIPQFLQNTSFILWIGIRIYSVHGCRNCYERLLAMQALPLEHKFSLPSIWFPPMQREFPYYKRSLSWIIERVLYSAILQSDTAGNPTKLYYISLPSYHYCRSNFKVNVPISSFVQIYTPFLLWGEVLRCGWTHCRFSSIRFLNSCKILSLYYGQVLEFIVCMVVGIAMKGCQLCRHSLLSINSHFLLYGFLQCKESFLITKGPSPGLQREYYIARYCRVIRLGIQLSYTIYLFLHTTIIILQE